MATVARDSNTPHSDGPAADHFASVAQVDRFSYDDSIVRYFATATLLWGLLATLVGLVAAVLLVLPKLFFDLGPYAEYATFGRLRPVHTSVGIFAFAGNAIFAAIYYSTQRLCKAPMWSRTLSWLHFCGWQLIIVAAAATLPLGMTQGREFAELEWPIDIAIAVVWILFFGVNFLMTLANRRERHLYLSLWFYLATIVCVSVIHVLNNLVFPISPAKSYSVYAGVQDAFMQWWYGENAMAFLLTVPFLGLMYYFLPKAAERPVYSYKLAIVHFWSLVILFVLAGPHHLHYTSLPEWASTLGMLFGVMLWMPLWGGLINGFLTLRGAWKRVGTDPVLKFFVVGLVFYGLSAVEGSLFSIKSINGLGQYTDWTIAHVHAGALGWNGMMTFGMVYWLAPRLFQTKLWSTKLASAHFWISTVAVLACILPLYLAGMMQSSMLLELDDTGRLTYPDFITTVQPLAKFRWASLIGGALYLFGFVLMTTNYLMTWMTRPATYDVPVYSARPLIAMSEPMEPNVSSTLETVPVLDAAKKLDVWTQLRWHRRWERLPGTFTMLVVIVIVGGSMLEMLPMFLIRGSVPTIGSVTPYTPLELAGRDIYVSEGCFHCHSQQVRPILAETLRYGEFSQAGEFVYDHPTQWGSRRIGPDLAREGGKQPSIWHWQHLESPQLATPGSVMPTFEHLLVTEMDFTKIEDRVRAAKTLGANYDFQLDDSADIARKQAEAVAAEIVSQGGPVLVRRGIGKEPLFVFDTQAVALIAYLQRLGVDLAKPAPDEAPARSESPPVADPTTPAVNSPAADTSDV